jgi:hypothetical protein
MATGRALIVGVRKPLKSSGWTASQLSGVDDDCRNMKRFLREKCHFEVKVLEDREATHKAVLDEIDSMVRKSQKDDFFIFVYSGHGGQVDDRPGGDEADRKDEVLLTYDKPIVDDELYERWKKFRSGVRILTLMDACHSGTMSRKATARGTVTMQVKSAAKPPMIGLPTRTASSRSSRSRSGIRAKLIHIGACRDTEKAGDTKTGGRFTRGLLTAMHAPPDDYEALYKAIVKNVGTSRQVAQFEHYGTDSGKFVKEEPFKIDILSDEQITAIGTAVDSVAKAWNLRRTRSSELTPSSHGIILSQPPKHRLDLVLDGNSITDVAAKAYVLGLFEGVTPAGPAGAIDELLGGTIRDFVSRRMFSARVGEVFMLPIGSSPVQSEVLLFVGLGQLDRFYSQPHQIQRQIAGTVIRTLVQIGIDEFATVLIGGGSGQTVQETLANLVAGFVEGLRDVDPGDRTRRIILCENNPERYSEMVDVVYSYARTGSFDDIRLTIFENPPQIAGVRRQAIPTTVSDYRSRMFLHVTHMTKDDESSYESILLTPGGKATAVHSSKPYDPDDRRVLLRGIGTEGFDVEEFGEELAEFALSEEFIATLSEPVSNGQHLVVVHDAESSKLPWETLRCGDRAIALDGGISRKYILSGDYSIAKWLERRRFDEKLDILLVIDPTLDLDGAKREGEIIHELTQNVPSANVTAISGKAATKDRLLKEFQSGAYDIIHYAGHAGFDEDAPEKSGIRCSEGEVLTGGDLTAIGDLPALVFFNACQSARVRKAPKPINELEKSVSFAEAFLRGGIANFICTYWPVGDESAEEFAKTFYQSIVDGQAVGDALLAGRQVVHDLGNYDWADYIHYGDPDFRIKEGNGEL